MEKLTAQQAKMVIEYFSAQAAEDLPEELDAVEHETHLWMTRFQVSLAVERQVGEWWWESLVECQRNLQSFDRDPEGWVHEVDAFGSKEDVRDHLQDQVSWSIDNAWNNSGA